jgi:hypothetical protein
VRRRLREDKMDSIVLPTSLVLDDVLTGVREGRERLNRQAVE